MAFQNLPAQHLAALRGLRVEGKPSVSLMLKYLPDRWRSDVFFRMAIVIVLAVTLVSILATAFAIRSLRVNAETALQDRAMNIATVLSQALSRPLFDGNAEAIGSVADAFGLDPQVVRLRIVSAQGGILVNKGAAADSPARSIAMSRDISYTSQGRTLPVGKMDMVLSSAESDRKLRAQTVQTVAGGLLVVLATLGTLYLVGRRMVRPFRDLEAAIHSLAHGQADIELSGMGRADQIGRWSASVNQFRDALEGLRQAEQKTSLLLEEKTNIADKLKAIYDSSNDAVMLLTGKGFLDCNERTLEMFGVASRQEFIAYHPSDLSPPRQPDGLDSMEAATKHILHAFEVGESRFEWMHARADGAAFPAEVLLSAFDYAGERVLQATVRDISQRKRIEYELQSLNSDLESRIEQRTQEMAATLTKLAESRQMLQGIVDTALDAVVRVDADGIIIGWNRQAENIFGWSAQSVLGRELHLIIVPHQYREAHLRGMARYIATSETKVIDRRIEMSALHQAGHEFPIELAITRVALDDSSKFEFCSFIRDITRRKKAEEEIRISLERQKELIQLKSRFVSMASHEFRTPLATILTSTDLLKHYIDRLPPEKRDELFDSISLAVRRMTGMLDDILTIGRDEAGYSKFNPSQVSVDEFCKLLVMEVLAEHELSNTPKPDVRLHVSGESRQGLMDEVLLRHIFGNLLSNAVKYSPQGAVVDFAVHCAQDGFHFAVSDQGIGIPKDDMPRLFDSFHRATNVGNIPGTGLGLAIVKRSVELHSGTIAVSSEAGTGTRFEVVLPRVNLD